MIKKLLPYNFSFLMLVFFIISVLIIPAITTLAQSPVNLQDQLQENLNQAGITSGYGEQTMTYATEAYLGGTIGLIISYILGFVGTIFLIIIIFSGFQWMTAGGNEETVTKARKRITNSVIGLVIIFMAFIITYFITEVLVNTTQYES